MIRLDLSKRVRFIKGVGEEREKILNKKLNIFTLEDIINHYPRRYIDFSSIKKINELQENNFETFIGTVTNKIIEKEIKGLKILTIYVKDETGQIQTVWFNQTYMKKVLKPNNVYCFAGKIEKTISGFVVKNPEYEKYDSNLLHTGRIVPVYPSTEKISQKILRNIVNNALKEVVGKIQDYIPIEIREKYNLSEINFSIKNIHFPENYELLKLAKNRLIFEEFYLLQLALLKIKNDISKVNGIQINNASKYYELIIKIFPFELTNAQKRVLQEVIQDLGEKKQMNRLIQGDVGSGKTAIALAASYVTIKGGYQVAFMAPTEVLAIQHFEEAIKLFKNDIKIALLIGSTSKKEKESILYKLKEGEIDLIVGTHSLIQDNVYFSKLGLVITDEQHRFGVRQRVELSQKGDYPNILVMTATPIPRTLSLVIYGDMDISIIDEMPPGRKKIMTFAVDESYRNRVNNFIKKQLDEGRQVYWICPLIEKSEVLNAKSAIEFSEKLKKTFFSNYNIACLHGRLSTKERDDILFKFKQGIIHILVSTTVVEVGVNVPNASVIVIENAERFGLSQLHQLRGRVGRGEYQSYCILFNQSSSDISKKRMQVMERSNSGFYISEMDLKLRGPGDFFGLRQHGMINFKLANVFEDMELLKLARKAAEETLKLNLLNNDLSIKLNKLYLLNIENIGL